MFFPKSFLVWLSAQVKWRLSHCALICRGLFLSWYLPLPSPRSFYNPAVFPFLSYVPLLSFPSSALAIIPLPPIKAVLHPTCSSATRDGETAPLQFDVLPNYHPMGVDLGPPGACLPSLGVWAGGVVFPAFLPAGGQSNQLAPDLHYSLPSPKSNL